MNNTAATPGIASRNTVVGRATTRTLLIQVDEDMDAERGDGELNEATTIPKKGGKRWINQEQEDDTIVDEVIGGVLRRLNDARALITIKGVDMNTLKKHEKFLYPVVRVYGTRGTGSGTVLYSKKDPENDGEFQTFVLTNYHVIESNISIKDAWDSIMQKEIKKEFIEPCHVEIFDYVRVSIVDSSNRYRSEIVAYSKEEDLAIIRMETPRQYKCPATLIPRDDIKKLTLFQDVVVSGCSLAHEPFCNFGQLTFFNEIIERKKYMMTNAVSIFGNSGGALFLADSGYMIGVPSRISGIQLGFGVDIITWMGFSCHPERLYEFFDDQEFQLLYDEKETYKGALERREKRKKDALLQLKAELAKEGNSKQIAL